MKKQIHLKYSCFVFLALFSFGEKSFATDYLPNSSLARTETEADRLHAHGYFGLQLGVGQASGTEFPLNSGLVYGAPAGVEVLKSLGVALTYLHNSFTYQDTGINTSVHQILLEANVFSLLILSGGFHAGDVIKFQDKARTADFGLGFHLGFDASVTSHMTVGLAAYATLVTEKEDHHTLLNLMVPVKYWF
jgi:hypothetical protein